MGGNSSRAANGLHSRPKRGVARVQKDGGVLWWDEIRSVKRRDQRTAVTCVVETAVA